MATGPVHIGYDVFAKFIKLLEEILGIFCDIRGNIIFLGVRFALCPLPSCVSDTLHSHTEDTATRNNSGLSVLLKDASIRAGIEPTTPWLEHGSFHHWGFTSQFYMTTHPNAACAFEKKEAWYRTNHTAHTHTHTHTHTEAVCVTITHFCFHLLFLFSTVIGKPAKASWQTWLCVDKGKHPGRKKY